MEKWKLSSFKFVSEATGKELASKNEELRKAYLAANEDKGQQEAMNDWENIIDDGSKETADFIVKFAISST